MGKLLGLIMGMKLPSLGNIIGYCLMLVALGSVWFVGYSYAERGNKIKELQLDIKNWEKEKKIWLKKQISLNKSNDSLAVVVGSARADKTEDSLNFVSREQDFQKVIAELRADRNYWKDYGTKLESGEYEVQKAIWPFKGKKLVKKKID